MRQACRGGVKIPPMPRIIEYTHALQTLTSQGLVCNYHNSGAFGFPRDVSTQFMGWIGPDDDTIREAARPFTRRVPAPYPQTLASLAAGFWRRALPGPTWVQPMSHWAYELQFGGGTALHRLKNSQIHFRFGQTF